MSAVDGWMEERMSFERGFWFDSREKWGSERNCKLTFGKNRKQKGNSYDGYRLQMQLHQKEKQGLASARRWASVYAVHQASHSCLRTPPCLYGVRVSPFRSYGIAGVAGAQHNDCARG